MEVTILKCKGCGANLSPDNTVCVYCGSQNVIVSDMHPLDVEEKYAKRIANYYKEQVKQDPTDGESLFALGMFYLNLKLYELAIRNFELAINRMPDEPDIYYYYALALIQGKRPKLLGSQEVKRIEEYLRAAMQLEDKAKYYYLAAIINYDFYAANGFKVPQPDYNALLNEARTAFKEPAEIKVLLKNVIIRDENLYSIINN